MLDEELTARLAAFDKIYERLQSSTRNIVNQLTALSLPSEKFQIAVFQAALTIADLREEKIVTPDW